ncbi:MAG TPA: DUF1232 domain-containing protein [Polyangiaceae bacterium]|nr:DUF1232 domain-containing protein [Polyangiaceae bacterium]
MKKEAGDDFYQTLRRRIADWLQQKGEGFRHAQILLLAPDLFHLMCRLALDSRVPVSEKAKLAAAIAYFVSPVDLVPEAIVGPVGYLDDVALAAYTLNSVINAGSREIAAEHWAGEGDLFALLQQVLAVADEMIGAGLWRKLRSVFDSRSGGG